MKIRHRVQRTEHGLRITNEGTEVTFVSPSELPEAVRDLWYRLEPDGAYECIVGGDLVVQTVPGISIPGAGARIERKAQFISALAEFLGGANQARMSIALDPRMKRSELAAVAELWRDVRQAVPGLMGWLSVEEAQKVIEEFIG